MNDSGRFVKFNEQARKALSLAQEEAHRLEHSYLGPEHMLLGLIRVSNGTAARVLRSLGIELSGVRSAVEFVVSRGPGATPSDVGLTPRSKKVIELTVDEARRLNHQYIGSEHLLLGILREGESIAAGVLASMGVNLEKARAQTLEVLGQQSAGSTESAPPLSGDTDPERVDKFTERARTVLTCAGEEAQRLRHNYIGTEHLLLGMLREGESVAARVLNHAGVDLNNARTAVESIVGRGDRIILGDIGLTPRSKKVLGLAVEEARRLNHRYVGTEHLLLGLVREGEGIAAGVLESLGVGLEMLRTQTIQIVTRTSLGGEPPADKPAAE
jgi:ATP-dependent Clp protease ATP-binding subunit ClpA